MWTRTRSFDNQSLIFVLKLANIKSLRDVHKIWNGDKFEWSDYKSWKNVWKSSRGAMLCFVVKGKQPIKAIEEFNLV